MGKIMDKLKHNCNVFKNKLTVDLSRYISKSLVGDTSCCNFFLIVNCSRIVPEILKMFKLYGYVNKRRKNFLQYNSLKVAGHNCRKCKLLFIT